MVTSAIKGSSLGRRIASILQCGPRCIGDRAASPPLRRLPLVAGAVGFQIAEQTLHQLLAVRRDIARFRGATWHVHDFAYRAGHCLNLDQTSDLEQFFFLAICCTVIDLLSATPISPPDGSRAAETFSAADARARLIRIFSDAVYWVEAHWMQIVLASLAGAIFYALLNLARRWGVKLCQRSTGPGGWYATLGRALAKTGHTFMILASARLVVGFASAPPWLTAAIVTLFTLAAVFQAAVWVREIVFGAIDHRTSAQGQAGQALVSALGIIRLLVTIIIFAIAIVVVLSNLGVNVTGLVAGLGVGGIAIGLAAQGIFADLFAALAILFDRPFRVGDTISYDKGAGAGTVEAIGLKSTRIRGVAGEERIIANRKLLDFEILNTTRRDHNRFTFNFLLDYGTPAEIVLRVPHLLREAVESHGYKFVHGGVTGFAANGLSYDVSFESVGADFPADARDKVAAAILTRFREEGVGFSEPPVPV